MLSCYGSAHARMHRCMRTSCATMHVRTRTTMHAGEAIGHPDAFVLTLYARSFELLEYTQTKHGLGAPMHTRIRAYAPTCACIVACTRACGDTSIAPLRAQRGLRKSTHVCAHRCACVRASDHADICACAHRCTQRNALMLARAHITCTHTQEHS